MKKIKIACQGATVATLAELVPFQGNLKSLSKDDLEKLKARIQKAGFTAPFHVWKADGKLYLIDGHQRREALMSLATDGFEVPPLPIDIIEAGTLKEAKEILLSHAAQFGKMEGKGLMDFAAEVDLDLSILEGEFRFPEIHFDSLLNQGDGTPDNAGQGDPDAVPVAQETRCKPGDIWQLGRHRMMCGSSTVITDVEALMDGKLADLIITDPPYNVAYKGKTKDALEIQNDSMGNEDFYQFLLDAYTSMYTAARDGAGIYVFHADSEGMNFRKALLDAQWKLAQCCVWVKQTLVLGPRDYHWQHEPVLYGWKPTGAHSWYSDRKQTTVWNFDKPARNGEHPTMKPVDLVIYPMENSSKKGDLVFDPFGGSGTTLIAAEKVGRTCNIMELDAKYCDVILKRWENFTGQSAELVRQ